MLRNGRQAPTVGLMSRLRSCLSPLIGLLFLVQGFAVSAAPMKAVSAPGEIRAGQVLAPGAHCAGSMMKGAAGSCCDQGCPDMSSCAFAHIAVAAVVVPVFSPVLAPRIAARVAAPRPSEPQSLLRPPISSHG